MSSSVIGLIIGVILAAVGASLALTLVIKRNSKTSSQSASATGGSTVRQTQAGRDVVEIGTYNHTEVIQGTDLLLADGEELATSTTLDEFVSQVDSLWNSASEYVIGVSLYGRPFMPTEAILTKLIQRNVSIRMVLVDPESKAASEIAEDKCRYSRTIKHYEVLAENLGINELTPAKVLDRIAREVAATVDVLARMKKSHPTASIEMRLMDQPPTWKGTIVDGAQACYLIYDVPRMDVPFRWSSNKQVIHFYRTHYFDLYWRSGTEVKLA